MADEVQILANKTRVYESANLPVTAYFRTRSTAAADTPADVSYRVHCITTNQEVLGWTSVSPASSVAITLSGASTDIQEDHNEYEIKELHVRGDAGASDESRGRFQYRVINLRGTE